MHDVVQPFQDRGMTDGFPDYAGTEVRYITTKRFRERWVALNRRFKLNGLEGASLYMAMSMFLVAGCICDNQVTDYEAGFLLTACFLLNGLYFVFMIYRLWYGMHQYFDALAADQNFTFTDTDDRQKDQETFLLIKARVVLWTRRRVQAEDGADEA